MYCKNLLIRQFLVYTSCKFAKIFNKRFEINLFQGKYEVLNVNKIPTNNAASRVKPPYILVSLDSVVEPIPSLYFLMMVIFSFVVYLMFAFFVSNFWGTQHF